MVDDQKMFRTHLNPPQPLT